MDKVFYNKIEYKRYQSGCFWCRLENGSVNNVKC